LLLANEVQVRDVIYGEKNPGRCVQQTTVLDQGSQYLLSGKRQSNYRKEIEEDASLKEGDRSGKCQLGSCRRINFGS
jgi:hypothetical protein